MSGPKAGFYFQSPTGTEGVGEPKESRAQEREVAFYNAGSTYKTALTLS